MRVWLTRSRKGQVMDTPIHPKFTSLAYALILLREAGYPSVFYGDMYGTCEPFLSSPTCDGKLGNLILARKLYAYGEQQDYFEDPDCIGWVRRGVPDARGFQASGMAVVMNWVGDDRKKAQDEQSVFQKPRWMRRLSGLAGKFGVMSNRSPQCQREMNVGVQHAGEVWTDILEGQSHKVTIGSDGTAVFPCGVNCVAVYVSDFAVGREDFPAT
jgi:alpha-amylase